MNFLEFLSILAPGIFGGLLVFVPLLIKDAVDAYANKTVTSVFDKRLERYKAKLSRSAMAKHILFEREMAFYDKVDMQIAELIPLIQDVRDSLIERPFTEDKKKYILRFLKLVPEMKDTSLRYQAYLDPEIWGSFNNLVIELQSQEEKWFELARNASTEKGHSENGEDDAVCMCDDILMRVALFRTKQVSYLKSIAEEE